MKLPTMKDLIEDKDIKWNKFYITVLLGYLRDRRYKLKEKLNMLDKLNNRFNESPIKLEEDRSEWARKYMLYKNITPKGKYRKTAYLNTDEIEVLYNNKTTVCIVGLYNLGDDTYMNFKPIYKAEDDKGNWFKYVTDDRYGSTCTVLEKSSGNLVKASTKRDKNDKYFRKL